MVPPELLSMAFGSLTGFIFKFMAQRAKEKAEMLKMALKTQQANEDAHNAAVQRVSVDGGKWVRRLIVVSTLFGVIIAPFFLTLLNEPLYVQIAETKRSYLFGLFGGGTDHYFVRIDGYLMIPEVRQTLTAIVGFYFGSSVVKSS